MPRLTLDAWHSLSLRRSLLMILLPGMMVVVGAEMLVTWRNAVDATNAAYDRALFGAVKSIDANISTDSGGLGVELPYRVLEFFELTASGQVFCGCQDQPTGQTLSGLPATEGVTVVGEEVTQICIAPVIIENHRRREIAQQRRDRSDRQIFEDELLFACCQGENARRSATLGTIAFSEQSQRQVGAIRTVEADRHRDVERLVGCIGAWP